MTHQGILKQDTTILKKYKVLTTSHAKHSKSHDRKIFNSRIFINNYNSDAEKVHPSVVIFVESSISCQNYHRTRITRKITSRHCSKRSFIHRQFIASSVNIIHPYHDHYPCFSISSSISYIHQLRAGWCKGRSGWIDGCSSECEMRRKINRRSCGSAIFNSRNNLSRLVRGLAAGGGAGRTTSNAVGDSI